MSYIDPEGKKVTTASMLRAFNQCPASYYYGYVLRLKPRRITKSESALKRGTWFHHLLEAHYTPGGTGWAAKHAELTLAYNGLMEEEQEALGPLPDTMRRLMRSYLWHYGASASNPWHGWTVHGVELTLECEWPDGDGTYRGRVDILAEDEFGMFVGDHKTNVALPNNEFRLTDPASVLYIWCAQENGVEVSRFVWNYIRAKAPSIPSQLKNGLLSKAACDTDYPTTWLALKEYGLNPEDYTERLRPLLNDRYAPGKIQRSAFFRRDSLDKDPELMTRVIGAALKTRDMIDSEDYDPGCLRRNFSRSCDWCSFRNLCTTELAAGPDSAQARTVRAMNYTEADPLQYYNPSANPLED